jgi:biopolymer transport protein ExbB
VATAVGIGVALPAVALYNYFQRQIASMMSDSETLKNLILAYLEEGSLSSQEVESRDVDNGATSPSFEASARSAARAVEKGD